jgi:Arc/MetJ family transcription regulator
MLPRLQVAMTEAEYREVALAAVGARTTVPEWVRRALREARRVAERAHSSSAGAVRERGRAYGDLLASVMEEHGLPDEEAAVRFALRRAADPPLGRDEILAMEGTGWEGDLADLRPTGEPELLW